VRLSAATLVRGPTPKRWVELALEMLRAGPAPDRPLRIADIAPAQARFYWRYCPHYLMPYGIGTDISAAALHTASAICPPSGIGLSRGFHRLRLMRPRCRLVRSDLSNPPYIRSAEIIHLAAEVRDHDPLGAGRRQRWT